DKRGELRTAIRLNGKLFVPERGWGEECVVVDFSVDGAGVRCGGSAPVGTQVVLYVDCFGRFEGKVVQRDRLRLGVKFQSSRVKRERTREQLAEFVANGRKAGTTSGMAVRPDKVSALTCFVAEDGTKADCRVIDIGLSGATFRTDTRPAVGQMLAFGETAGRVVHHTPDGIAVEFVDRRAAEVKRARVEGLEAALAEAARAVERAENANLAKSQFLASMSHELRTPLNAIIGFSDLITSRLFEGDGERQVEYAGFVRDAGHHLLSLINDILDLAKIESGRIELQEEEMNLAELIEEALALVAPRAASVGCMLGCELASGLPLVFGDERALKQVLLNLLANAVKFTPAGGTITVFARIEAEGSIAFGVQDTGAGIAADDLARVFEKFGQGRQEALTGDKGTGLGLPIVKGLVEAHGGTIVLQSAPGEGTCATVTLPRARVRLQQKAAC
ncbi:MAG: ATP-binding protein, partial [Rhizomicrobium sp.]